MIGHQGFEQIHFLRVQAQPGTDLSRHNGAARGMILALALAQIMNEGGQKQHARVFHLSENLRKSQADRLIILTQTHPMQFADRSQQVFIDRVQMIDVVLHAVTHRREFRNENLQEAGFHHRFEHAEAVLRILQEVEELADHFRVFTPAEVEMGQVGANDPAGMVMEMGAGLGGLPEKQHERSRAAGDQFRFQELQAVVFQQQRSFQNAPPA